MKRSSNNMINISFLRLFFILYFSSSIFASNLSPQFNIKANDVIESVAFTNNGEWVAFAGWDNKIKVFSVKDGSEIISLKGHTDTIYSIAFSSDGKYMASSSLDKTIKVWSIQENNIKLFRTLKGHEEAVWSVKFTPDNKKIISGSGDTTLKIWEIDTGSEIKTLEGHSLDVFSVAVTPDGNYIVSGSYDKTIKIWDLHSGKTISTLNGHTNTVRTVDISPDGKILATGSWDKTIKIWDIHNINAPKEMKTLKGHSNTVIAIDFTVDGKKLASVGRDANIRIWDVENGSEFSYILENKHSDSVYSVAFNNKNMMATAGADKYIKLWNIPAYDLSTPIKIVKNDNDEDTRSLTSATVKKQNMRSNQHENANTSLSNMINKKYALVIGINDYKNSIPPLRTAVNDAKEVATVLEKVYGFETTLLLNNDATKDNILETLEKLAQNTKSNDQLLIYYAGHGHYESETITSYWLPIDAKANSYVKGIKSKDVSDLLKMSKTNQVLIIADSCYSGTMDRSVELKWKDQEETRLNYIKKQISNKSRVLLASGGNEPVSDGSGAHSVFASYFIDHLKNMQNDYFTAEEIHLSYKEAIAGNSNQTPQYKAINSSGHEGGDFVFIKTK